MQQYKEIKKIINELLSEGYKNEANLLSQAISNGSTGLEIFMALSFELDNLIKSKTLPSNLLKECKFLKKSIDKELNSMGIVNYIWEKILCLLTFIKKFMKLK